MGSVIVTGVLLGLLQMGAEGAAARPAKDAGERGKAVAAAARYLQGQGFADPMLAAEVLNDSLVAVEVDHKGWVRMDKTQKTDFLERMNGAVLSANGNIAIDIHVSMNGSKIATSTFASGQQVMRLLE
jgi:hypothetical protein